MTIFANFFQKKSLEIKEHLVRWKGRLPPKSVSGVLLWPPGFIVVGKTQFHTFRCVMNDWRNRWLTGGMDFNVDGKLF